MQLSSVVLPEPVPPEIRMLQRTRPMTSRMAFACSGVIEPNCTKLVEA
jgi:hypothetical protein